MSLTNASSVARDHKSRVVRYYDDSQFMYDHLWMNKKNLSMHYGFWDKGTKSLHEAMVNENRYVAEALQIAKGDVVLDAGCGVGGTVIQFAETYSAIVTGATLSSKQVGLAKRHAVRRGVDGLTSFVVCDYCHTGMPDGSFDKAYAIESACYAESAASFLAEMFRLLKPGGLAVHDGFLLNPDMNATQRQWYREFLDGWVLRGLETAGAYHAALEECGFENIKFTDATEKIMKSSREMSVSAKFIYPVTRILNKLRLVPDAVVLAEKACIAQLHLFQEGVTCYGVFCAEKPR